MSRWLINMIITFILLSDLTLSAPLYSLITNPSENDLGGNSREKLDLTEYHRNRIKLLHIRKLESDETSLMYRDTDYYYYKDKIPREYLEAFLVATKNRKDLRSLIYAMMRVESADFTAYIATNKNKTIDHGPLMLNSSNIKDPTFVDKFFPKEDYFNDLRESNVEDIYVTYIAACINLLDAHLTMYEGNKIKSLKAYNGGPKANKKGASETLKYKTNKYARKVMRYKTKNDTEYAVYIEKTNNKSINDLYLEYKGIL